MDGGPDVLRQLLGLIAANRTLCLKGDDGVHQYPKCGTAFLGKRRVCRGLVDVSAEHHSIMGGVADGKAHICHPHRFEPLLAAAVRFPFMTEADAQGFEPFGGDCGKQGRLVRKMSVQRRPRDAKSLADTAKRQPADAFFVDDPYRLPQQRPGQVAVVVGLLLFPCHMTMVR